MIHDLVDVEERNREHPESFQIPPAEVRNNLKTGDFAKVIFSDQERMWVQVDGRDEEGRYVGSLKNQPVILTDLKFGDSVKFEPKNVCDFMEKREDRRPKDEHISRAKDHLGHAIMFLDSGNFDTARTAILRSLGHLKQISLFDGTEE